MTNMYIKGKLIVISVEKNKYFTSFAYICKRK